VTGAKIFLHESRRFAKELINLLQGIPLFRVVNLGAVLGIFLDAVLVVEAFITAYVVAVIVGLHNQRSSNRGGSHG